MSRIAVLGTGALACSFGAALARAGEDVTLCGSWPEGLDRIRAHGVTVEDETGAWSALIPAVHRDALRGPVDLVLVLVKAHATPDVAPLAARAVTRDGLVLTLQNGLGHVAVLEAHAPGRVVAGVTTAGATVVGPGRVRTVAGRTIVGSRPGLEERVAWAARTLTAAGRAAEVVDDVAPFAWRKLAVNCAINPVGALHGVANGAVWADPARRAEAVAAAAEVALVAQAAGYDIGTTEPLVADVALATASNHSSMLQDLTRGARTEIDALCGAVAREGRRLGVPTPANDRLWRAVRAREGRTDPLDGAAA